MSAPAAPSYLPELRRRVGKSAEIVSAAPERGTIYRIECDQCAELVPLHLSGVFPVDQVEKTLKRKGWRLGKPQLCPSHASDFHARKAIPMSQSNEPESAVASPANSDAAQLASDAAKAAKRAAIQWLEEAFNIERGQYRAQVSDAVVASETGLSEPQVKALREDLFGPLKEPQEIDALRSEIARIEKQFRDRSIQLDKDTREAIGNAMRRLDAMASKNGWAK